MSFTTPMPYLGALTLSPIPKLSDHLIGFGKFRPVGIYGADRLSAYCPALIKAPMGLSYGLPLLESVIQKLLGQLREKS